MHTQQKQWTHHDGWKDQGAGSLTGKPQLVLVFGARALIEDDIRFREMRSFYPEAEIVTCSTAGEILGTQVSDDTISLTAIQFEKTTITCVETDVAPANDSFEAGVRLADKLPKQGLVHAMVFSDGSYVNGTALVNGLNEHLPPAVSVTGGLVGDGPNFKKTAVGLNRAGVQGKIVLIGFYGDALKVGYGSLGGWDTFGVERTITKSKDNVLFELDGQPALDLYKTYLGDQAAGLPSTGLLFPLRLRTGEAEGGEVVRTILGVSEADKSMTFAGDMPEGAKAALMKANFERLIDGASGAGNMSVEPLGSQPSELAILISCVGRKLVLKERTEEEVEAVRVAIGPGATMAGFYSYGELCPTSPTEKQCKLHNQTMTITTFREEA